MPSNDVDLEVLLGWIPEAEGFRITILYNAPGDQERRKGRLKRKDLRAVSIRGAPDVAGGGSA